MPSLLILLPLAGIIIMNLLPGKTVFRAAFWIAIVLFTLQICLGLFHNPALSDLGTGSGDFLFHTYFSIDHFSSLMLVCIGMVSFSSLLVAKCTISEDKDMFKLINLLIISSIGMSGIVMVKDLFSMYVFMEVTAVSSFIMIAFEKDIYALEGAFKYMILSAIATILMLSSIALLLLVSSNTSFAVIREAIINTGDNKIVLFAVAIFMCGLFIKAGLVPFHAWLPDAYMSAPPSVSVQLAGIVTKASGIYTMIRLVASVFGCTEPIKNTLIIAGTASVLIGAIAALGQGNMKRMLAYSSISQVGYIVLGLGAGNPLGIAGAVFHLFNHSIFKSLLFVNAASVERMTGTNSMQRLGGISSKMPYTATTSVVGMLSTCGIPPLSGFWSKVIIIIALWQAGRYGIAVVAVLASILTLAYLLSMQRKVFFGILADGLEDLKEAQAPMVIASLLLGAITIGIGIFFPAIFTNFILPAGNILVR